MPTSQLRLHSLDFTQKIPTHRTNTKSSNTMSQDERYLDWPPGLLDAVRCIRMAADRVHFHADKCSAPRTAQDCGDAFYRVPGINQYYFVFPDVRGPVVGNGAAEVGRNGQPMFIADGVLSKQRPDGLNPSSQKSAQVADPQVAQRNGTNVGTKPDDPHAARESGSASPLRQPPDEHHTLDLDAVAELLMTAAANNTMTPAVRARLLSALSDRGKKSAEIPPVKGSAVQSEHVPGTNTSDVQQSNRPAQAALPRQPSAMEDSPLTDLSDEESEWERLPHLGDPYYDDVHKGDASGLSKASRLVEIAQQVSGEAASTAGGKGGKAGNEKENKGNKQVEQEGAQSKGVHSITEAVATNQYAQPPAAPTAPTFQQPLKSSGGAPGKHGWVNQPLDQDQRQIGTDLDLNNVIDGVGLDTGRRLRGGSASSQRQQSVTGTETNRKTSVQRGANAGAHNSHTVHERRIAKKKEEKEAKDKAKVEREKREREAEVDYEDQEAQQPEERDEEQPRKKAKKGLRK